MKKITLLFCVLTFLLPANAEYVRGAFNDSWNSPYEFDTIDNVLTKTVQFLGTDGAQEFKITEFEAWNSGLEWGVQLNPLKNDTLGVVMHGNGNASIDMLNGYYYTFKLFQPSDWWERNLLVFETEVTPASFVSVVDDSITATSDLTITVLMDANVTQDTVYVRYTNDGWSTNSIMKAAKTAEMTYQATISSIAGGTVVNYYVMTSSFPQTTLESSPDEYFLKRETNSGANYSYTAPVATQLQEINNSGFNVYVNNKSISLAISSDIAQNAQVSLIALSGNTQSTRNYSLYAGENTINLPQVLDQGVYIVQVQMGTTRLVKKIAIQ